jgi:hypothetical protein
VLGVVLQGCTCGDVHHGLRRIQPADGLAMLRLFGKSAIKAKRTETTIRIIAGVLLIFAGFYFLATF